MKNLLILPMLLLGILASFSQEGNTPSPIIFIYDASGSMWGQLDGKTKMQIASEVVSRSVGELPENQNIGLVVYGHRKKGDCRDVEILVDMENSDKSKVVSAIKSIKPLGKTPLAFSATQVIDLLRKTKKRATVVMITDGIESCDGDLCKVIENAKKEGIDLKLHIVGFGLKESETDTLKCAAKAGGGNYYDADDATALDGALDEATAQTVDLPDGNLSIYATRNGEPIDAYVKAYDINSKRKPIAGRTYRDTAFIYLPPSTYNLEVKPLEGSDLDAIAISNVQSFEDQIVHRNVSFDAGKLKVMVTNNGEGWDATVAMYNAEGKKVASTRTYGRDKEMEVNPGNYKLVYQALRIKGLRTSHEMENVEVKSGATTEVSHEFDSGTVFIDSKVNGESIDSVVNFNEQDTGKNVAGGRTYDKGKEFLLNPGTYTVTIQPLGEHKGKPKQTLTVGLKKDEQISREINF